ncbi:MULTISPECIES: phosphatidate cytidylyltransferase [unclassified Microbacterium]|uniref:phosphatidate cytidylyltransferase n=1 Tax=unclassified Microbacterium TaxID=2609290 RepID=UPI00374554B9
MTDAPGPGGSVPPEPPPSRRSAADVRRAQAAGEAGSPSHMRAARAEFETHVAHARAEFEEANERIKQRTGRDLIVAIAIGLAIGAVVIASLIFYKWIFVIFAIAAMSLGVFEFTRALLAAGRRVDVIPQLTCGVALLLSGYFLPLWLHWIVTIVVVVFLIVWRLLAQMIAHDGRTYAAVVSDVLTTGFVQLYVPFLGSLALILLARPGGEWWVLAFIIVTVAADTGAYGAGLSFGRHPMAPRISPKKTWEGFAGSLVAALIAGVLLAIYMLGLPWWAGLIFGAAITATATIGDLGESMIKRDLGIKDMSSWLPGHGGVLDRLDSILPSATAALALSYLLAPLVVS